MELSDKSPHEPRISKYIGLVDDEKPILFAHEGFNCFDYWDRQPWQKIRVYGDELPRFKYSNTDVLPFSLMIMEEWAKRIEKCMDDKIY